MSKRYWELTVQLELNEDTGKFQPGCPRNTKVPLKAVECEPDKDWVKLDFDKLEAELISAAKKADLKSAAEEDST